MTSFHKIQYIIYLSLVCWINLVISLVKIGVVILAMLAYRSIVFCKDSRMPAYRAIVFFSSNMPPHKYIFAEITIGLHVKKIIVRARIPYRTFCVRFPNDRNIQATFQRKFTDSVSDFLWCLTSLYWRNG